MVLVGQIFTLTQLSIRLLPDFTHQSIDVRIGPLAEGLRLLPDFRIWLTSVTVSVSWRFCMGSVMNSLPF